MFGKREWFRPVVIQLGVRPVGFRGWFYSIAWLSSIFAPTYLLASRHQGGEALVWLLVSGTAGLADFWHSLRQPATAKGIAPAAALNPSDGKANEIKSREIMPQESKPMEAKPMMVNRPAAAKSIYYIGDEGAKA